MLKFLQERVNKKTKDLDALKGDEKPTQEDYDKVSKKQGRVKELMRRLAEKLGKEDEGDN
ncbi:MAG: hypothetical protein ACE37K_16200 [Planctomycetota bacterium]|jgi:hypothetical protein